MVAVALLAQAASAQPIAVPLDSLRARAAYTLRAKHYAVPHEKEIWADFTKAMAGASWKNWIANASQETADKPANLGYFVGYRICQSYYQEMADKRQAVHDILNISDYPAFLAQSRYAEKLAAR